MNFQHFQVSMVAALSIAATACSGGGQEQIRTGTPAYYYKMALASYENGDYPKTNEWLAKATSHSPDDYTPRAWTMRFTIMAGMIRGNADLADQWETGAKENKSNPMRFFKKVSDYRGEAGRRSVELAESWGDFEKAIPEGGVEIRFPYPSRGGVNLPSESALIQKGVMPKDPQIETVETALLQRGMIQQIADAVGAGDDSGKAQSMLKTLPVPVPRKDWMLYVARTMYNVATLYDKKKLSDTPKREFFLERAQKSIASADKDAKEVKELKTKIDKDLKEVKARKG
jgi:hypothetical protein